MNGTVITWANNLRKFQLSEFFPAKIEMLEVNAIIN